MNEEALIERISDMETPELTIEEKGELIAYLNEKLGLTLELEDEKSERTCIAEVDKPYNHFSIDSKAETLEYGSDLIAFGFGYDDPEPEESFVNALGDLLENTFELTMAI